MTLDNLSRFAKFLLWIGVVNRTKGKIRLIHPVGFITILLVIILLPIYILIKQAREYYEEFFEEITFK